LFGRAGNNVDALSLAAIQCLIVMVVMTGVMVLMGTPDYWNAFSTAELTRLATSGVAGLVVG